MAAVQVLSEPLPTDAAGRRRERRVIDGALAEIEAVLPTKSAPRAPSRDMKRLRHGQNFNSASSPPPPDLTSLVKQLVCEPASLHSLDQTTLCALRHALRMRCNSLASINIIPPELLFFTILKSIRLVDGAAQPKQFLAWVALSHVCHHWRTSLLSIPEFWSSITCSKPLWVGAMLKRSGETPLSVALTLYNPGSKNARVIAAQKQALAHLPRIRELRVKRTLGSLHPPAFSQPAPMLERFYFRSCGGHQQLQIFDKDEMKATELFAGHAPNLSHLTLDNTWLYPDSPLWSNLTSCELINSRLDDDIIKFLSFLHAKIPRLRSLVVAFLQITMRVAVAAAPENRMPLRDLVKLELRGAPYQLWAFLGTALLPSIQRISLEITAFDTDSINVVWDGIELHRTAPISSIQVGHHGRHGFEIQLFTTGNASFVVRSDDMRRKEVFGSLCTRLAGALDGCQSISVGTTLGLSGSGAGVHFLPSITHLTFFGRNCPAALGELRSDPLLTLEPSDSSEVRPALDGIYFPNVRHVTLRDVDFTARITGSVELEPPAPRYPIEWLSARRRSGLGIDELCVEKCVFPPMRRKEESKDWEALLTAAAA